MDAISLDRCRDEKRILNSNLWKFFRALRAQANPIYCLLVASPVAYAWVTVFDKAGISAPKIVSVSRFINSLSKMPSKEKYYSLSISLYHLSNSNSNILGKDIYRAEHLCDLSVDLIKTNLLSIIAYHCAEAISRGERFELNPSTISYFKFKLRYVNELKQLVQQCNGLLEAKSNN